MRKHLTIIIAVVLIIIAALILSGRQSTQQKQGAEGAASSSDSGYHLVTIADMGISFELPDGWTEGVSNNPAQVREFVDPATDKKLMILSASAAGKDFTAALAETDKQSATGYEGQASIKIIKEDPLTTSVMPGTFRHRELIAAGMKDLAAVFELSERFFTITLRHDDGSDPTPEDELMLRAIIASVKPVQ